MNKLQELKDLLTLFLFPQEMIDNILSIATENAKELPSDDTLKHRAYGESLQKQRDAKKYACMGTFVRNARKAGIPEEEIARLKRLEKERIDNG